MKEKLSPFIVCCFYHAQIHSVVDLQGGQLKRFRFKMHPRTWAIFCAHLLLSPILLLIGGITGIVSSFRYANKIQSWSSYEVYTSGGQPTKWEMYRKF